MEKIQEKKITLSPRHQRLLKAFQAPGMSGRLQELGNVAFGDRHVGGKKCFSWARNQARFLVKHGFIRKIDRGTYIRLK